MEFNEALEEQLKTLIDRYIGVGSGLTPHVKAYDDHLRDFDLTTENPFVVVAVNRADFGEEEIGASGSNKTWECLIYFLYVSQDWATGKSTHSSLVNRLVRAFDANKLLDAFHFTGEDGRRDQVWSSEWQSVTFDKSGQDGYYSFVSEMYLKVDTSTS